MKSILTRRNIAQNIQYLFNKNHIIFSMIYSLKKVVCLHCCRQTAFSIYSLHLLLLNAIGWQVECITVIKDFLHLVDFHKGGTSTLSEATTQVSYLVFSL